MVVAITDQSRLNDFRNDSLRDALHGLIQARDKPLLAIDMGRVDYLSSSGVAVLVGLKRRIDANGGGAVLFRLQADVLDVLRTMKLDHYLILAEDEDQALASLRSTRSL